VLDLSYLLFESFEGKGKEGFEDIGINEERQG
jgi:hypothetical protein